MDHEHFGGRTDDDLFADDFEPVAPEEQVATISTETGAPVQDTNITSPATTAVEHSQPSEPAPVQKPTPAPQAPRGLANSRHAPANRPEKQPRNNNRYPKAKNSPSNNSATQSQQQQSSSNAPPSAPKELREKEAKDKEAGRNTASVSSAARIGSGANPRTKLTEDELAAKMAKMRIMAAEKTKRFEQAQRDENEHAAAYAKGMEEDRKRRAEQAARRKAAEEDRKKMEDERERNRERKMRAMGAKEGGSWDEGKEERMREQDRSSYRGHRGVANTAFARGLADGNEQGDGYHGGRRGGRGGFGGGRGRGGGDGYGGRSLFEPDPENESAGGRRFHQNSLNRGRDRKGGGPAAPRAERAGPGSGAPKTDKPKLTPDEFPALPGSKPTAPQVSTNAPLSFASLPLSPAVGRWDDEVQESIWKNAAQAKEAADAQAKSEEN
ncbi:hypothetical protein QBC32DRAFT_132700 [Pseudoneurospora amorphoporcata]|uniref:Uncharacterized protein n=1 Tax=Pseudoneurospora amorphoporcata TaxID=241081 RepID=A0AAN6NZN8_9PEZI|nr:hypothetical protein QBC32DRAFT_132700 [Pseudoneurospora amorphoporcata]